MLSVVCLALLLADSDRPLVPVATLGKATMVCRDYGRLFATPDGKRAVTRRGEWFDLEAGRRIDSPFALPTDSHVYSLLDDGTVVVETPKHLHFYPPDAVKPNRTLDTLGRRAWVSGDGAVALCQQVWTDETVSLLVAEKRGEWRTVADGLPPVKRLTLNPAGTHAAVLCEGYGDVAVFNLKTQKRTDFLEERPKPTPREPDGTILIQCFGGNRRTDVALSADGKVVYIAREGDVGVFDSVTGEELKEKAFVARWWKGIPAKHIGVSRQFDDPEIAWLGDGSKQVRVTDGGVLRVFDTVTSKQTDTHSTFPAFYGVKAVDDRRAITWTADGRILTWDFTTGRPVADVQIDLSGVLSMYGGDVAMSADGKELIASASPNSPRAVLADARTGQALFNENPMQPVFGPYGRVLIYSWDKQSISKPGSETPLLDGVGGFTSDLRLHSDTTGRLAVAVKLRSVEVFEWATGKRRWQLPLPPEHRSSEIGDGGIRQSGLYGRKVVLVREGDALVFDLPTQKLTRQIELHGNTWMVSAISADGRWLAVATAPTSKELHTFTLYPLDHPNPAEAAVALPIRAGTFTTGIAFTPDGKRLLTSHNVGVTHAWDISRFTSTALNPRAGELWAALGSDDGEVVGKCMTELVHTPRVAVAMVGRRLLPAERIDEKAVKARVAELGNTDFRTREAATQALTALDERVVPLLKASAAASTSPEVADRLERVRAAVEARDPPAEWSREARAVEVLETIGGPAAERLLTQLAAGAPGARLTSDAGAALKRLRARR